MRSARRAHIAGRAGSRKRAAAESGGRGVDGCDAMLQRGEDVCEGLAVGVVAVHGEPLDGHVVRERRAEDGGHASGRAGADRVRDDDLVAPALVQRACDLRDRLRGHRALKRTAEAG